MAVPKKKVSKGRSSRRHQAYVRKQQSRLVDRVVLADCSNCGSKVRAHHVCAGCGHYRGEQIINKLDQGLDKITTIKA